jgi:hypothetical protein
MLMLTLSLRCRAPKILTAAALGLSLATPALAADLYRWKTDDGGYAYTDDAKRIPEHYRKTAKLISTGSLTGYDRYTPGPSTTPESRDALSERLERLRAFNVAYDQAHAGQPAAMAVATGEGPRAPSVRMSPTAGPSVEVSGNDDGGPVMIEERRFRIADGFVTRTDTVVRQGDRIIAVVKPRPRVIGTTNTLDFQDEKVLERR